MIPPLILPQCGLPARERYFIGGVLIAERVWMRRGPRLQFIQKAHRGRRLPKVSTK